MNHTLTKLKYNENAKIAHTSFGLYFGWGCLVGSW